METVSLFKRALIYFLNSLLFTALGLSVALPLLLLVKIHVVFYILIGVAIAYIASLFINVFLLTKTKGYSIPSFFFSVKVVGVEEKDITVKQAYIRMLCETLLIFAIIDCVYLIINRTERGVIDRLSDTFMIDLRR